MTDFDFTSMLLGMIVGVALCLWIIIKHGCSYNGCLMCDKPTSDDS